MTKKNVALDMLKKANQQAKEANKQGEGIFGKGDTPEEVNVSVNTKTETPVENLDLRDEKGKGDTTVIKTTPVVKKETVLDEEEIFREEPNHEVRVIQNKHKLYGNLLDGFVDFANEPEPSSGENNSVYVNNAAKKQLEKIERAMGAFIHVGIPKGRLKKHLLSKIITFFYTKHREEIRKMERKTLKQLESED